jgi:thioredoxin
MISTLTLLEFNTKIHDTEKKGPVKSMANKPIVIDFYADWCGPCKAMYPTMERLSEEFLEKIDFYKINVDGKDGATLSKLFNIRSIPTVIYIHSDSEKTISALTGNVQETVIRTKLEEILS